MSDDLVRRLRDAHADSTQRIFGSNIFEEAADALTEARAEIERLRHELETSRSNCAITANSYLRRADAAESELSTLRARVREVVGPIAKYVEVTDSDWAHDSSEIGCTIVNGLRHSIKLGHLRAARQLNEDLK